MTRITSPAEAPERGTGVPPSSVPMTVTATTSTPADETSPPTTGHPATCDAWATPSMTPSVTSPPPADSGTHSATSAPMGRAPMAARSLNAPMSAFHPTSWGLQRARST